MQPNVEMKRLNKADMERLSVAINAHYMCHGPEGAWKEFSELLSYMKFLIQVIEYSNITGERFTFKQLLGTGEETPEEFQELVDKITYKSKLD